MLDGIGREVHTKAITSRFFRGELFRFRVLDSLRVQLSLTVLGPSNERLLQHGLQVGIRGRCRP